MPCHFQYSQVTFFAASIMHLSPLMCKLTPWFTTCGKFHAFPRFLPLKPWEQGRQHTCFHVVPKTTRILWTWMGYHLWNSHCFPCCWMFKQCNLPNSKKVGRHPVGKDGLWNKNKKTILVSFLNFYQANGNKNESERAQQLAGGLLKCKGSQDHSCNRVCRYPSPQNDIFLNNY